MIDSFSYDTSGGSVAAPARRLSAGGYEATEARGRRRPPRTITQHEDTHADGRRRRALSATTRDLLRNLSVAAWAVRKHIDYVADFTFQAATPDEGFNREYEKWQTAVSTKNRFDVAGRHSARRALRLTEACKTVDGDVGWLKIAPPAGNPLRGTIQAIEGDRIFMPPADIPKNSTPEEWVNGVRVNVDNGRALAYGICKRVGKSKREFQRIVSARNMFLYAAFEFRFDQVRGISPIASALNHFQDTAEAIEFSYAKLKIGQLFGLAITTTDAAGAFPPPPETTTDDDDDSIDEESTASSEPRINLNRGPFVTELDPGESASILESHNPSTETVNFIRLVIHLALRALDIPFSFLDESFTNFYGSRGGLIQYLHACHSKVLDLIELLDDHHAWRVALAVEDGELVLPSGWDLDALKWEFVPGGVPWWDSTKEVRGAAMEIAAGFSSPRRKCREIGTLFRTNIDETAEDLAYAKSKGVPIVFADSTAFAPAITVQAPVEEVAAQ